MMKFKNLIIMVLFIFVLSGYGKLFASPGIEGFSGMLGNLGFPIPAFFAVLVGVIEFVGGIMLLFGFFHRIVAILS